MKSCLFLAIALVLFPFTQPFAHAEEISRTSWWPNWEDFYVSDFATYYGPNVDHPSNFTVNSRGEESKQPMYFDNEITAAYLIDSAKVLGIGPTIRFNYSPVLGKGFEWNDVGLKFIDHRFISTSNLHVAVNFYVIAPTAAWSKAAGMRYALKTTPSIAYDLPNSQVTIGAWTELKDYVGVNYGTQFKVYYGPYAKWRLSKHFALNLLFEEEYHHDKGMNGAKLKLARRDIEPGFIWTISNRVSVNPYVAFYIDNKLSADHASLGAVMNARIL